MTAPKAPRPLILQVARATKGLAWLGLLCLLAGSTSARAQDDAEGAVVPEPPVAGPDIGKQKKALENTLQLRMSANDAAAKVQEQIDEISDETDQLLAQYRTAVKQIESIRTFNGQMSTLIAGQESELSSVADRLDRVDEVGRNVTPLMIRMIDALEKFVALDVPFLKVERATRIESLRSLMDRADLSVASKFRQIMEAYQIENEYGRTIEAYRGKIMLDGQEVTADLLRFGRISLAYQSLDGTQTGAWNQERRQWEALDESYGPRVRYGLRIARKLVPPDLIEIPLPPAENVQAAAQ